MTVETATYISDLNSTYPASGNSLVEGDDHIRLLKSTIKASLPNIAGAVTPTHTELNYVDGVTQSIQPVLSAMGLWFLSEQSASTSATIDFTSGISSTYEEYELHIINAVPDSGTNNVPWLYTSADAGGTWPSSSGDYDYTYSQSLGTTTTVANGSTTATKIILAAAGVDSTTAYGGLSAVIRFYNPAGTTHHKRFNWSGSLADSTTNGNLASFHGTGSRAATEAINGIRFQFSANNILSGKFKLYGVRKS